ncbi:KxYKxGKxW signal peptide domain-containing protein [Limosilactobacillus fastidiosus]|uniref:KxYKxGKxW signal peptide domain-containing protein n=1 Tax=Limosilactobacillus fastidiosus TaxID=2759855 RepID=A0A7W3TZN7_9LACO|nr:KxYKxGKxW signal peptide domain-containing protein [Limosilactobacillus fastidiosus]MBB1086246.1 KxYKxGKxW signal peptide domain-containing protein [Limosilactobacillus fastidiosus]MCD7085334.1 KxYKxGKxW signal peptide domain-containing protein [Limosilactobacillus fastidiosus]MCD7114927.1 KxYKxGKxW signal peptide domain-containing protein [Limosilactobacillus fastidiosus]MCD7116786.1 KxYKxGKxW signal peptide domain-containing protein [Limosilactobacillus fastidiosus]
MRYKLYKTGKLWLTVALTISSSVSADVNSNELPANNQQVVQNDPQSKTQQVATDNNEVTSGQTNGWQNKDSDWYYYQNSHAQTGWQTINNHNYYFDLTNASAAAGWQNIGDDWYYFDPTNV